MSDDSLRARVLEEWRGLPEPPTAPERCHPVSALLDKLLPKLGLRERLSEAQILEAWRDIVGSFLAEHSVPEGLAGGVLHVRVLQPSVRYELDRAWKPVIIAKLQERFGKRVVKEVRFRL